MFADTYREEDPLEQLAVVVRIGLAIEGELVVLVVVLLEVQQDGRGLEHIEVVAGAVDKRRDAAVRVHLDEPWLLLRPLPDVYWMHA